MGPQVYLKKPGATAIMMVTIEHRIVDKFEHVVQSLRQTYFWCSFLDL